VPARLFSAAIGKISAELSYGFANLLCVGGRGAAADNRSDGTNDEQSA
jgi:hypothetical protein